MTVPTGPLVTLGSLVAGIEVGNRVGPGGARPVFVAGVAALGASWFVARPARAVPAAIAFALLGCATMQRALDGIEHHPFVVGRLVTVDAVLVEDPVRYRFRSEVLVRVAGADRIVVVHAVGDEAGRFGVLAAGDRVTLEGRVAPLPAPRWQWQHAVALLDEAELHALREPAGLMDFANHVRAIVVRGTRPLPTETRALLLGFLLGDTRGVPPATAAAYRDAGLSHLLAVSGANVAFVLVLVAPLLRRLRLGGRTVCALATILVFAAMTRFEPSVLRASVLAAVSVVAVFAGRPQEPLRALTVAVVVLLLVDPFLSRSVGFQLSCAASAGIVGLARPIAVRLPGPRVVREPLAVSIAAQLAVTPILLAVFGSVPLLAPATNLLAAPAAAGLGVYGLLAALAGGAVPVVAPVLMPPVGVLVGWVSAVAAAGARVGGAVDARGVVLLGVLAMVAHRAVHVVAARRPDGRHLDAHDRDGDPQPHA